MSYKTLLKQKVMPPEKETPDEDMNEDEATEQPMPKKKRKMILKP